MDADSGALVTIKPNRDGSGSLANPFAADANGFARFYAAVGRYDIRVTFAGSQQEHHDVVLLEDATLPASVPGEITTVLAAGDNDNVAPAAQDAFTGVLLFETGAGDANLTGLVPVANGRECIVVNKGPNLLTIVAEDTGSTAANRFYAGITLETGRSCTIRYSTTLTRFLVCA
jgi:hypothetical protein